MRPILWPFLRNHIALGGSLQHLMINCSTFSQISGSANSNMMVTHKFIPLESTLSNAVRKA